MKNLVLLTLLICFINTLFAASNPDDIIGVWKDGQGKGQIQIFKQNGKYYGKIIWLKKPQDLNGKPKVDKNNPNPSLRNKPVLGLLMLKELNIMTTNGLMDVFIIRPMGKSIKPI